MAKKPFFPDDLEGQIVWQVNFKETLRAYAAKYDISSTQAAQVTSDSENITFWFEQQSLHQIYRQALTAPLASL